MKHKPFTDDECLEGLQLHADHVTFRNASQKSALSQYAIYRRCREAARRGIQLASRENCNAITKAVDPVQSNKRVPNAARSIRRWLLTAAQDETPIHQPFWNNLLAYAADLGATVMVGGFTYNKSLFEDHASRTAVFASAVQPYLQHDNLVCGGLLFAASMNVLPTAQRPLSGLEGYSKGAWAVYPHAKTQHMSVPTLPGHHPAMIMTTGACTLPNYIEKKAGQLAEHHHTIGAVIVEVDEQGRIFCRHIGATNDGSFQDLDAVVRNNQVTRGHPVEAIINGDIHLAKIDPTVTRCVWGLDVKTMQTVPTDTLIDALKPRHQFQHDLFDHQARNHHRRGDHIHAKKMIVLGAENVDAELSDCTRFIRATQRPFCRSVIVASNHNDALMRWLKETDPRQDVVNMKTWCELNVEWHCQIEQGAHDFDLFRYALSRHDYQSLDDVVFVPRNGSYLICQDYGGIECGAHGDEGPNGARGSLTNLKRISTRMIVGHGHSAGVLDGVMMVGLFGLLDQGYNSGPSGWSHTLAVVYPNSRRTLITIRDGKWRA